MSRTPSVLFLSLEPPAPDPAWTAVPPRGRPTLRAAYAVALLRAVGVQARQLHGPPATGVGGLLHELLLAAPDLVAIEAGPSPSAVVRVLTDRLLARTDPPLVAWTGLPDTATAHVPDGVAGLGPDPEHALVALALGGATPVGTHDLRGLPSPWTSGVLPVGLAAELGVEHAREGSDGTRRHTAERIADELRWIDARAVGRPVVPLVGPPVSGPDDEALVALGVAAPSRVRVAVPVGPHASPALLDRVWALEAARLDIVLPVPLRPDERRAVDTLLARPDGPSVALLLRARADAAADADAVEADVVTLAGRADTVDLRWEDDRGVPVPPPNGRPTPELRSRPAVAAAIRAEAAASSRVLDALRDVRVGGRGPARGVHDLMWETGDPAESAAWLADVLGTDGLLLRLDGGPVDAAPGIAGVRAPTDPCGVDLPTGDRLHLRGWGEGPVDDPAALTVLTLRTDDDRAALRAAARSAATDGTLPAAAAHARWTLEGEGRLLGSASPTARLERLWVRDGVVRRTADGPSIGHVGDSLEALRRAAAAAPPLAAADADVVRLVRALVAARALRTHGVDGPLRVSGLGGPLDPAAGGPLRATVGVLIAAGDDRHLVEPTGGRVSRVTRDTALIWELLAAAPHPAEAAARLAAARSVEPAKAADAVRRVASLLGPTLEPPPVVPR